MVTELLLHPADNQRLANLCGPFDQHIRQIEQRIGVEIHNRGANFAIHGEQKLAGITRNLLEELYQLTLAETLSPQFIHLHMQQSNLEQDKSHKNLASEAVVRLKRSYIRARGVNQQTYIDSMQQRDLTFGVGPAGTGKTYLAVACAVEALESDRVRRIVLTRPAVEAGEKLGFLPGDLSQKVDPYLRPLYDALYEMLGFDKVAKLLEKHVIEVAPLAYMRGRTLNESFIILDEAQNTTKEQMKMFLTRIGYGSSAVVTGDVTQIDLPKGIYSGLKHAIRVLESVQEVGIHQFSAKDVVRHPLVQKIVRAYDIAEKKENQ